MLNENIYNAPLLASLLEYSRRQPARFHMPGHKGVSSHLSEIFGQALGFDVTELPETDNLFENEGAILEAEKLAAAFYGCRETLFSAGGSTLCIQAMLRLVSKDGGKVICARNIHRSVVNTMALLGLEPVWVYPRPFEGSALPGSIAPEDIETAAVSNTDAVAVFITSPDYYGIISDIKGISEVCKRHNLTLLVDNAHGAHLKLVGKKMHPIENGADMTCDSAHKTLPALTGGAFLHINSPRFSKSDGKAAMTLFGSTSPSYLIMLSLDLARAWMEKDGNVAFEGLIEKVKSIRELCDSLGFFTPKEAVFDPTRIVIDTASCGINGNSAALLFRENGISLEMSDERHLVLIPSPFNSDEDFERLKKAICLLERSKGIPPGKYYNVVPETVMPLKQAVFADSETVSVDNCIGRIAAQAVCPCPPCVPLVMPGELISHEIASAIKSYGVLNLKVVK
ncbi:MAG: aminotransferase class V-fold PLP-dependent enzyme [[Clostridium] cellulosi]